jgi:hypothetical protein
MSFLWRRPLLLPALSLSVPLLVLLLPALLVVASAMLVMRFLMSGVDSVWMAAAKSFRLPVSWFPRRVS